MKEILLILISATVGFCIGYILGKRCKMGQKEPANEADVDDQLEVEDSLPPSEEDTETPPTEEKESQPNDEEESPEEEPEVTLDNLFDMPELASNRTGRQSTIYMEHLSTMQLEGSNNGPFAAEEVYSVVSNQRTFQRLDATIYTVERQNGKVILVFESEWKNFATLVFSAHEDSFIQAVLAIQNFFSSQVENKREKVRNKYSTKFIETYLKPSSGVLDVQRVLHSDDDFDKWKSNLDFNIKYMLNR